MGAKPVIAKGVRISFVFACNCPDKAMLYCLNRSQMTKQSSAETIFNQPDPIRDRPIYRSGTISYNPEDYGWSYDELFDFPPGKYFLGDPSFVLDEIDAVSGEYEDTEIEGVGRFVRFPVPYTGGVYEDEEGYPHECPCGSLGVVPIGHLGPTRWAALRNVGRIVDFEDEFQVQLDSNGNVYLGWNWLFIGEEVPPEADIDGKA